MCHVNKFKVNASLYISTNSALGIIHMYEMNSYSDVELFRPDLTHVESMLLFDSYLYI